MQFRKWAGGLILATSGFLGIAGFGVPGALGMAFLALFFWDHWLVQLAGWEEILLVGIGLFLLALEIFVIPGFGIAGILGIGALLGGLGMSMVGAGATWKLILTAAGRVVFSLLFALIASLFFVRFLPRMPFGLELILDTELPADAGFASAPESDRQWLHKSGTTISALRPAGIAEFDGERIDVVSDGEFINPGENIVVTRVDGNRIVVRHQPTRSQT
jgi:membrane-bound serine protease (ClpP class)